MNIPVRIGMDTSKSVFQLHGVDENEVVVVRRQFRRAEMIRYFERLPPVLVAIESCGSSHHWATQPFDAIGDGLALAQLRRLNLDRLDPAIAGHPVAQKLLAASLHPQCRLLCHRPLRLQLCLARKLGGRFVERPLCFFYERVVERQIFPKFLRVRDKPRQLIRRAGLRQARFADSLERHC